MTASLAMIDAEIDASVKPCVSAYCWGRFRVKGLEYDTDGCMDRKHALAVAREMSRLGGPDEWLRAHRWGEWVRIQEVRRYRFRMDDPSVAREPDPNAAHGFVYVEARKDVG